MPGGAKLVAGYELQFADDLFGNSGSLGMTEGDALADPSLTDRFRYEQVINALYATYQRPFDQADPVKCRG